MLSKFLFDSAFPNGAYSHSFGFESYLSWRDIKDIKSYQKWLEAYILNNFTLGDGVVYVIACAFKDKKLSLLKLAKAANSSILAYENRMANIAMARSILSNTEFMHGEDAKWYAKICDRCDEFANPAVSFALLSDKVMIQEYAYSTIISLTQNATRAIPLAYKKSNELIYKNIDLAKKSAQKSINLAKNIIEKGYFSLNLSDEILVSHHEVDISMFAHEELDFRLFMS